MSSSLEYTNVWHHWTMYYAPRDDFNNEKNFEKNMEVFDEHVNGFIKEGWRPHGGPQFSDGWFHGSTHNGTVVQALVRNVVQQEPRRSGRIRSAN